jgi:uncharacterized protein YjiS (DUF1127 family)
MSTLLMTGRSTTGAYLPQLVSAIREFATYVAREIEARRSMRELMAADDATLADLGLSRGAIERAVRSGRRGG